MNFFRKKKKIICIILILIIACICFAIFENKSGDVVDIINIGNYGGIPNNEKYFQLVSQKWKALGHDSKLIFEDWDCYDELPKSEFDVFIYDAVVYESLRDRDILEEIDNIDTSYTFNWANNLLEGNSIYGVPFLLCSDFLIYNKENIDLSNTNYLNGINTTFTTQYKSMVLNYYLTALLSKEKENTVLDLDKGFYDQEILNKLYELAEKMNINDYRTSNSSNYTGKEEMNIGKYNALYGFSEAIYSLDNIENQIVIKDVSLTEKPYGKAFYVDLISMKKGVSKEEEELYTELIELMTSSEINYEYIYNNGDYLYLLSANKYVLQSLANTNRIYYELYGIINQDTNRVFLYSNEYYSEFSEIKDDLKGIIDKHLETAS